MSVFQESRGKVTMKQRMGIFSCPEEKEKLKRFIAISWKKGVNIIFHINCEPALMTDLWTFLFYLKELEIRKIGNMQKKKI